MQFPAEDYSVSNRVSGLRSGNAVGPLVTATESCCRSGFIPLAKGIVFPCSVYSKRKSV